jgi:hypothetical protein
MPGTPFSFGWNQPIVYKKKHNPTVGPMTAWRGYVAILTEHCALEMTVVLFGEIFQGFFNHILVITFIQFTIGLTPKLNTFLMLKMI